MKSTVTWVRRAQRALRMLSELHRLGYQNLRGMSYLHPLGYRLAIAPKESFSVRNGAVIPNNLLSSEHTVITSASDYFGWGDADQDNARALAEKFVLRFPKIAAMGKGRDWEYAGWLCELLGFLEQGDWVPVVYWEHMAGEPEDLRFLPIWVEGKENLAWNSNEAVISLDNPSFILPPC